MTQHEQQWLNFGKKPSNDQENESETRMEVESGNDSEEEADMEKEEKEEENKKKEDTEDEDDQTDEDDEDEPFDRLIDSARNQVQADIEEGKIDGADTEEINKRFRKAFRDEYRDTLIWIQRLRRNPTHRKIMDSVTELKDGLSKYDYEECLEGAVSKRKHLLNRLVPDFYEEEEENGNSE